MLYELSLVAGAAGFEVCFIKAGECQVISEANKVLTSLNMAKNQMGGEQIDHEQSLHNHNNHNKTNSTTTTWPPHGQPMTDPNRTITTL